MVMANFKSKFDVGDTVYELESSRREEPIISKHVISGVIFEEGMVSYGFGDGSWDSYFDFIVDETDLFSSYKEAREEGIRRFKDLPPKSVIVTGGPSYKNYQPGDEL